MCFLLHFKLILCVHINFSFSVNKPLIFLLWCRDNFVHTVHQFIIANILVQGEKTLWYV